MAARDRYSRKLECSQCGHSGYAEVSESDDKRPGNRDFRIDEFPKGFVTEFSASDPRKYVIRCGQCGHKFRFEQKSAYAPGGEPRR
jgi:transcription elongation factor Elf1